VLLHLQIALFEGMGRLLADVRAYVRRGRTRDVSGMLGKLVETANRVCAAISTHMQREESDVLPLLAAALGSAEQRAIVWHTLRWGHVMGEGVGSILVPLPHVLKRALLLMLPGRGQRC
jgi:hypothetical protein